MSPDQFKVMKQEHVLLALTTLQQLVARTDIKSSAELIKVLQLMLDILRRGSYVGKEG